MSVRIRPFRTLFAQRSLHTTSLVSAESAESGLPKPRTATDLGFNTSNAGRTRNLDKFDLETVGGNIDASSGDRGMLGRRVCS